MPTPSPSPTRTFDSRWMLVVILLALLTAGGVSAMYAAASYDRVWSLRFSPGVQYTAVSSDRGVTAYEPGGAGRLFRIPHGRAAAFSSDAGYIAVATPEHIAVAEMPAGRIIAKLPNAEFVTSLAFSNQGTILAALGGRSNVLRVWDFPAGTLRWRTNAHEDADNAIAFSPDDGMIATGGSDKGARTGQVRLWDTASGESLTTVGIPRHAYVDEVTFMNDGDGMVVALSDGRPNIVYDITDLAQIERSFMHPLAMITGRVVLSEDSRRAVRDHQSGDYWSHAAQVIDTVTGEHILTTAATYGSQWDAQFDPAGKTLLFATSDGTVTRWDLSTGQELTRSSGNRTPTWRPIWTLLASAIVVWLLFWSVLHARRRPAWFGDADWLLVPASGLTACLFIALLHWIHVADPWISPDPIQALEYFMVMQLLCIPVAIVGCVLTKAWRALLVALISVPALLGITAFMWMETVASV